MIQLRGVAVALLAGSWGLAIAAAADTPHATTVEMPAVGDARRPTPEPQPAPATPTREAKIVARAREEVARGVAYDAAYFRLSFLDETDTGHAVYPGGDLDPQRGVCTDVVIRALRAGGVDLQERVHADILARRAAYPRIPAPDANIDHRRVGPLLTYFRAHATAVQGDDWQAGDVVVWAFRACPACTPDHIGIVSDRPGPRGLPLALHNIGPKPSEDDVLDAWTVLGHFRL
jgi:uncharacterized protein YijF (DUF1287 family)